MQWPKLYATIRNYTQGHADSITRSMTEFIYNYTQIRIPPPIAITYGPWDEEYPVGVNLRKFCLKPHYDWAILSAGACEWFA